VGVLPADLIQHSAALSGVVEFIYNAIESHKFLERAAGALENGDPETARQRLNYATQGVRVAAKKRGIDETTNLAGKPPFDHALQDALKTVRVLEAAHNAGDARSIRRLAPLLRNNLLEIMQARLDVLHRTSAPQAFKFAVENHILVAVKKGLGERVTRILKHKKREARARSR
jgi:hypothetical protein